MDSWIQSVKEQSAPILQGVFNHPFIKQLISGELPKEIFHFYLEQDYLYLGEYRKALALLGAALPDPAESRFFLNGAANVVAVEQDLHMGFLGGQTIRAEPSPSCALYTGFLLNAVHHQPPECALAAVLPCFSVYKDVGEFIINQSSIAETHPYKAWIETYGGEEFARKADRAAAICESHARSASSETRAAMSRTYMKAAALEWMFWEGAWRQEQWPVFGGDEYFIKP